MASTTTKLAATAALATGIVAITFILSQREPDAWTLVESTCIDCHNDVDLSGDLSLQGMTPDSITEHPEIFENVVHRLRGRFMPPPGAEQPTLAELDTLIDQIERRLDDGANASVGHVQAQRLTRTEFAHAVDALLGIEIDPAEYLPTEIEVEGFTNIASALSVSPTFIEQYVNVARTVAHLAVGEPVPKITAAYFPPPADSQQAYLDGFPPGTRGGVRVVHTFPADGEYRLTLEQNADRIGAGLYPRGIETEHTLVVLVDKEERFRATIGGPDELERINRGGAPARAEMMKRFADIPLEVTAGEHEIIVTFIERSRALSDEQIGEPGLSFASASRVPGIGGGITMLGPYESPGISRTDSRDRIFICEPEVPARERECAEEITASLATRAFRRPATQADLDRLMPFYEEGRQGPGGFDEGIELMLTALLSSPDFLYRAIAPAPDASGPYPLDDYELATRLSFFLWSAGPDNTLLELAEAGRLQDADVLDAQVRRMLADPRAEVMIDNFALAWLNLDDLDAVVPDSQIFAGQFSNAIREAFDEEIRLFVGSVLLGDANVRDLLSANYTYLNERLADHYGIDGVFGPQFRRVELDDARRFGLLGKGAVLLRTSYGDRTSPVLRGAWVLEKLMGTPPTPPPPGVETDLTTPEGEEPRTLRARLEEHRANPNCGACHGAIDPYGLALENYTVVGRWRDVDEAANAPIDATSVLPGERAVDGPVALRNALLDSPDQFVQALTEKLMMYALGRELEYFDMPAVRAVVDAAEPGDYRFADLVSGIVRSDAFRMQGVIGDNRAEVAMAAATRGGRAD